MDAHRLVLEMSNAMGAGAGACLVHHRGAVCTSVMQDEERALLEELERIKKERAEEARKKVGARTCIRHTPRGRRDNS